MAAPTLTLAARALSQGSDLATLLGLSALDGFALDLQAQWDAFNTENNAVDTAIGNGPTVLNASEITFGDALNGMSILGSGFGPLASFETLSAALNAGTATGTLSAVSIRIGGVTFFNLSVSPTQLSLTTGGQAVTLSGSAISTRLNDLPDVLNGTLGILTLVQGLGGVSSDVSEISGVLDGYGITSLAITDGGDTLLGLSVSESRIGIEIGDARIEIDGGFGSASLGDLLGVLASDGIDLDDALGLLDSIGDLPGATVGALRLLDGDGATLASLSGPRDLAALFDYASVTVQGTDGADTNIAVPWYDESETPFVRVDLGAGNDSAIVSGFDFQFTTPAPTFVDLGADGGTLIVDDRVSTRVEIAFGDGEVQGVIDTPSDFESYTVEFSSGARLLVRAMETRATGDAGDDTVALGGSQTVFFSGGDGTDLFDLSDFTHDGDAGTGISLNDIVSMATPVLWDDGRFALDFAGTQGTFLAYLTDVERIGLRDGTGATASHGLAAVVQGIDAGFLLGGGAGDMIDGRLAAGDVLAGQGGDDRLLAEGFRSAFAPDEGAQVFRLYQATLGRAPDRAGHEDWTERLATGEITLSSATAGFVGSTEFQNVYGTLSDSEFVNLLYRNVLDRDADAGGLANWLNRLATGATREDVVTGFSESAEFVNATRGASTGFLRDSDRAEWSDEVFRVYQATLGRAPDAGGFENWIGRLADGRTLLSVIEGFTGSTEFQNTYGALDDAGFVDLLYRNVLGRAADAAGLADWTGRLAGGTSRAEVVRGFSESTEFVNNTAAELRAWIIGLGTDDTIAGGAGDDTLAGGALSDHFIFDAADAGSDTVLDLETWDTLAFTGFQYADAAAARADMTQLGADVVFANGDVTVTFLDTQLDEITEDMIWV